MSAKELLKDNIANVMSKFLQLPEGIMYNEDNFSIEKLEKEADKDLKIDKEKLIEHQQKAPVYMHRYLRVMSDFWKQLNHYNRCYSELKPLKYQWYKYYYDFTIEKPTEIDMYIKGDKDILFIQEKIDECEIIIKYLKEVCTRFANRSYEINNIIEWSKFKSGD